LFNWPTRAATPSSTAVETSTSPARWTWWRQGALRGGPREGPGPGPAPTASTPWLKTHRLDALLFPAAERRRDRGQAPATDGDRALGTGAERAHAAVPERVQRQAGALRRELHRAGLQRAAPRGAGYAFEQASEASRAASADTVGPRPAGAARSGARHSQRLSGCPVPPRTSPPAPGDPARADSPPLPSRRTDRAAPRGGPPAERPRRRRLEIADVQRGLRDGAHRRSVYSKIRDPASRTPRRAESTTASRNDRRPVSSSICSAVPSELLTAASRRPRRLSRARASAPAASRHATGRSHARPANSGTRSARARAGARRCRLGPAQAGRGCRAGRPRTAPRDRATAVRPVAATCRAAMPPSARCSASVVTGTPRAASSGRHPTEVDGDERVADGRGRACRSDRMESPLSLRAAIAGAQPSHEPAPGLVDGVTVGAQEGQFRRQAAAQPDGRHVLTSSRSERGAVRHTVHVRARRARRVALPGRRHHSLLSASRRAGGSVGPAVSV